MQALTGGFHLAWAIGAGAGAVGALIALMWLRPSARPAEEIAELREDDPVGIRIGGSMIEQTTRSEVRVQRRLDRAQRRKPLRLWISRRAARNQRRRSEKFVTQVRLGKAEAVIVPWAPAERDYASLSVSGPAGPALAVD